MDHLSAHGGESQLRLHDSCFDRCVQSLTEAKLDKTEQACIKNCYKSFALSFRISQQAVDAYYRTA